MRLDSQTVLPTPGTVKDVLIVGAGVAGVQAARQFLKLGFNVVVLEARNSVGGVWLQGYWGYGLQVPWRAYQFPEFPWPTELQPVEDYPAGQDVQRYVEAYADAFALRPHVRFGCKLERLRWGPLERRWEALYREIHTDRRRKLAVDYVVMCTGTFCRPYVPEIPGAGAFSGVQLPGRDFTDVEMARGRRVLVVGAGKTALDIVCGLAASRAAASVSLVYRKAHWPMPRRLFGVSVRSLLYNRAVTATLPPYYTAGPLRRAAGAVTAPLRKLFWKAMEVGIGCTYRTRGRMEPRVCLPDDFFYGGQILDDRLDEMMSRPGVTAIRGTIKRFEQGGAILQDGRLVPADIVLYCTGYCKSYDYLDSDMRERLGVQKDGLYLYRHILPLAVPHLAFVGSEVSTFSNILTHGLQALWLAHVLTGAVALPPPDAMAADLRAQERWRRRCMPLQRNRAAVLQVYMQSYHDQLLADVGAAPWRKLGGPGRRVCCGLWAECFSAYTAEDYTDLMDKQLPAANMRPRAPPAGGTAAPPPAVASSGSVPMPDGPSKPGLERGAKGSDQPAEQVQLHVSAGAAVWSARGAEEQQGPLRPTAEGLGSPATAADGGTDPGLLLSDVRMAEPCGSPVGPAGCMLASERVAHAGTHAGYAQAAAGAKAASSCRAGRSRVETSCVACGVGAGADAAAAADEPAVCGVEGRPVVRSRGGVCEISTAYGGADSSGSRPQAEPPARPQAVPASCASSACCDRSACCTLATLATRSDESWPSTSLSLWQVHLASGSPPQVGCGGGSCPGAMSCPRKPPAGDSAAGWDRDVASAASLGE